MRNSLFAVVIILGSLWFIGNLNVYSERQTNIHIIPYEWEHLPALNQSVNMLIGSKYGSGIDVYSFSPSYMIPFNNTYYIFEDDFSDYTSHPHMYYSLRVITVYEIDYIKDFKEIELTMGYDNLTYINTNDVLEISVLIPDTKGIMTSTELYDDLFVTFSYGFSMSREVYYNSIEMDNRTATYNLKLQDIVYLTNALERSYIYVMTEILIDGSLQQYNIMEDIIVDISYYGIRHFNVNQKIIAYSLYIAGCMYIFIGIFMLPQFTPKYIKKWKW